MRAEQFKLRITVETVVNAPVDVVWTAWTTPEDIMRWNSASQDWHTTSVTLDLRTGGSFSYRMEAKDGSMGFDFAGVFDDVKRNKSITYTLGDGRRVAISFNRIGHSTMVTQSFEAERQHTAEIQRSGWQAILDNFKSFVEQKGR